MKTSLVGKSVLKEIENKVNSENKNLLKLKSKLKKEKRFNLNIYSKKEFEKKSFSAKIKKLINQY